MCREKVDVLVCPLYTDYTGKYKALFLVRHPPEQMLCRKCSSFNLKCVVS